MSKIQRVAGTALTSVALVSLAACGGSSSKSAASSGKSAAKTSSTSSADTSSNSGNAAAGQTISGAELAKKQKAATGSDYAADISATTTTDKGSIDITGVTSVKAGKTDMKMTMKSNGKTIEEVVAGGVLYMQMNGQWYKMDGTSGTEGGLTKMLSQSTSGQMDNKGANQQWKVVSSDSSGTTYETSVQAGAIKSAASSLSMSASAPTAEKITEVTDAKGRPTKMTLEMPGSVKMEYNFSNYRDPITITAPANAKPLSSLGR